MDSVHQSTAAADAAPASNNSKRPRRADIIPQTPWWRVSECAAYAQVGTRTIYNAIERGQLRVARLGGSSRGAIRIHKSWCDSWLESQAEPIATPLRVAK